MALVCSATPCARVRIHRRSRMLDRRSFLARTGVVLAAAAMPSPLLAAVRERTPPPASLNDWQSVRAQFALAPGQLHFASFFMASHPRPVREAIEAFRRT